MPHHPARCRADAARQALNVAFAVAQATVPIVMRRDVGAATET